MDLLQATNLSRHELRLITVMRGAKAKKNIKKIRTI